MKLLIVATVALSASTTTANAGAEQLTEAFRGAMLEAPGKLINGAKTMSASWETIPPKPIKECMAETNGVINAAFVRCRNGRQELVNYTLSGRREILQERAIPPHAMPRHEIR